MSCLSQLKQKILTPMDTKKSSALAVKIAESKGLNSDVVLGLKMAAMIHDIGKIQIPGESLSKPGKLSHQERELIKSHSQVAYSILQG